MHVMVGLGRVDIPVQFRDNVSTFLRLLDALNSTVICFIPFPFLCQSFVDVSRGSAGMSIPKMSTPIMSIPKMSIPICLLCQNVYSHYVYCAKMSIPKLSTI